LIGGRGRRRKKGGETQDLRNENFVTGDDSTDTRRGSRGGRVCKKEKQLRDSGGEGGAQRYLRKGQGFPGQKLGQRRRADMGGEDQNPRGKWGLSDRCRQMRGRWEKGRGPITKH